MGHDHGVSAAGAHRGRLLMVFGVTTAILVIEVIGGLVSGSLALLADAGHMLTDAAGIGLALLAIWFAARPATPDRTFGFYRVEILAAVINAVLLFGVAGFVLVEAWRRLQQPQRWPAG
jgi:cobalt-zinc-cadmium efflux system protein